MSSNKLLCALQAMAIGSVAAFLTFVGCSVNDALGIELGELLDAAVIMVACVVGLVRAALSNGNRRIMLDLKKELGERERFAEASAARALRAYAEHDLNRDDAQVRYIHR